jgi:hypothetical protein
VSEVNSNCRYRFVNSDDSIRLALRHRDELQSAIDLQIVRAVGDC